MKNTIRVRKNRIASSSPQQVKILAKKGSNVVDKAENALDLMTRLGNSASALVMLNAEQIKNHSKDFAGWESLDVPGFGQGSLELARLVVTEFHLSFSILTNWMRLMMEQISNFDPKKIQLLDSEIRPFWEIENAIGSLRHLIMSQGFALSERQAGVSYFTSMMLDEKLETAFNVVWEAQRNVRSIFEALAAKSGQKVEAAS